MASIEGLNLTALGGESVMETHKDEALGAEANDAVKEPSREGPKSVVLDAQTAQCCLCDFGPTSDGLYIVPRKLICTRRMLSSVNLLESFGWLRQINLTFNNLTELTPLQRLHNLRELNASNNKLEKFPAGDWPLMTHLNLNNNEIKEMRRVYMPKLLILCLNNNQLRRLIEPGSGEPFFTKESFPRLHTLQLAQNKLYLFESTPNDPNAPMALNIQLPKLRALFLNNNLLTSLAVYQRQVIEEERSEVEEEQQLVREEIVKVRDESALGFLPELSVLHLRRNGLHELDGITLETVPNLQYLNLRENSIDSIGEIEKVTQLPRLQTMVLLENPIYESKNYRLEMRVSVQSLKRLDKDIYTEQESEEADLLAEQRRQERAATADAY